MKNNTTPIFFTTIPANTILEKSSGGYDDKYRYIRLEKEELALTYSECVYLGNAYILLERMCGDFRTLLDLESNEFVLEQTWSEDEWNKEVRKGKRVHKKINKPILEFLWIVVNPDDFEDRGIDPTKVQLG